MGLMLIGGGPAGTAGGLKITTAIVVMATLWGEIRGAHAINILGWRLARSAQRQALAVLSLFFRAGRGGAFLLMLFTPFNLNQCLFEICSALGDRGSEYRHHSPVACCGAIHGHNIYDSGTYWTVDLSSGPRHPETTGSLRTASGSSPYRLGRHK
ncbi:potassium transporter TrkG [Mobiluncus curtisii]|uniref:Potassium uptake protein, TrkH family n=1 Tax=Mobiluncus curtisii TaxID=2051 RepID=A0A2X3BM00_9ACTO|nr:potassium transporter TrkG [Mobiluncus curtisii]SQC01673.1 potassium uptake protein, TrkH family [Mobiluncus curtisii]